MLPPCATGWPRTRRTSSSPATSSPRCPTGSAPPAEAARSRASRSNPSRCGCTRRPAADRIPRSRRNSSGSSIATGPVSTVSNSNTRTSWPGRRASPCRTGTRAVSAVPGTAQVAWAGAPGEDLTLTIDAGLQLAVEQELLAAWIADKAKSVSAVVMDPYTGEIFAEATYPSYDANDYGATRREGPGAVHRPDRLERLRARIRVQDDDRGRGPRDQDDHARRRGSRTPASSSWTAATPMWTTRTTRPRAG